MQAQCMHTTHKHTTHKPHHPLWKNSFRFNPHPHTPTHTQVYMLAYMVIHICTQTSTHTHVHTHTQHTLRHTHTPHTHPPAYLPTHPPTYPPTTHTFKINVYTQRTHTQHTTLRGKNALDFKSILSDQVSETEDHVFDTHVHMHASLGTPHLRRSNMHH